MPDQTYQIGKILALATLALHAGCKTKEEAAPSTLQAVNALNGAQAFEATFFEGHGDKGFSCDNVTPFKGFNLIAVTENSPLLPPDKQFTCIDNFITKVPWEGNHWFNTIPKDQVKAVMEEFSNVKHPGDKSRWAFFWDGAQWKYNQPDCHTPMKQKNVCGTSVKVGTSQVTVDAVIFDGCPQNHWNNAIKDHKLHPDHLGKGNPCRRGKSHIDLHSALWKNLMLPLAIDVRVQAKMNQASP